MDGVLIIDKSDGMTSHDVVARARKILKEKRIGHTGTLDPFATGVMVLLVGRATRLAQFLSGDAKEYEATVRFGFETDTGDVTGNQKAKGKEEIADGKLQISDSKVQSSKFKVQSFSEVEIENALASLRGPIMQTPPMYSAKKIQGKKLYELARKGEEVERKAAPVLIYEFEAIKQNDELFRFNDDGTVDMKVRVVCSAGTYIRVLAESLGERLNTQAHLASLRRTRAGDFGIAQAVTLEKLQELADTKKTNEVLLPMKKALSKLKSAHLTTANARRVCNGVALRFENTDGMDLKADEAVMLCDEKGNLLAIGLYKSDTQSLKPSVVLATQEQIH
jgi:tRNA pseudouridine55 synthase